MRVRYSRRALSQLAEVHDYLLLRNQGAADKVTGSIRATIGRLRDMPFLGKTTDEVGVHVIVEPDYRYRVFYRVRGQEVFVIRILHGRQG